MLLDFNLDSGLECRASTRWSVFCVFFDSGGERVYRIQLEVRRATFGIVLSKYRDNDPWTGTKTGNRRPWTGEGIERESRKGAGSD